jgi:hypothetical protein
MEGFPDAALRIEVEGQVLRVERPSEVAGNGGFAVVLSKDVVPSIAIQTQLPTRADDEGKE